MSNSPQPGRAPVYGPIHKLLRFGLARTLATLGATDFADEAASARAVAAVRAQLAAGASHLRHEDVHVHPLLDAVAPAVGAELDAAHRHHRETFAALEALLAGIERAPAPQRPALGHALYLRFARFMAEDLLHMDGEETLAEAQFHAHYSDVAILAMHGAIIAEIPEAELAQMAQAAAEAFPGPELALLPEPFQRHLREGPRRAA